MYGPLTTDQPGVFGAVIARGAPQVLRLGLIYALLDRSEAITEDHLRAGLAVWQHCENSARSLFGQRLDNSIAETIYAALQQAGAEGLSRAAINKLGQGHWTTPKIEAALNE